MNSEHIKTDLLLIKTAREMFFETGCSRLNLRQVARKSGVNLGMFPYYFKTKAEFTRRVLQDFYDDFLANFSVEKNMSHENTLATLRAILVRVAFFVRENQDFMSALLSDVMNGEKIALKFIESNFYRHFSIMRNLIRKGQKSGLIEAGEPHDLLGFLIPGILMPIVVHSRIRTFGYKNANLKAFAKAASDKAILKRIDRGLRAITIEKGTRKQ